MNTERTIEFILNTQAKAERRMDKTDMRLDGISKLLQQGMRMLVKTDAALAEFQKRTDATFTELAQAQKRTDTKLAELAQAQKRTDTKLAELAQAHKATERSLKAFIDSLRHGRNGRDGG